MAVDGENAGRIWHGRPFCSKPLAERVSKRIFLSRQYLQWPVTQTLDGTPFLTQNIEAACNRNSFLCVFSYDLC